MLLNILEDKYRLNMRFKVKMKHHKGISEMFASMIVLLIVSVLGVLLYNVSLTNMNSMQGNFVNNINDQKQTAQERFTIVTVAKANINDLNITCINYGSVDVKITDVYVNNQLYHLSNPINIGTLSLASIIDPEVITGVNQSYDIKIVSKEGVSSEYSTVM